MQEKVRTNFKMIPVKNLSVVYRTAQRNLDETWAKKIADNMDPDQLDPLLVTKANGHGIYHVVDGQHRAAALKMLWGDNEQAPCRVVDIEDPARAAELFYNSNTGRKRPMPIDLFRVAVVAGAKSGHEAEVAVNKIIKDAGYKVSSAAYDGNISAVSALISIYKRYGADVLRVSLALLQQTWGMDKNAVASPLIRGFGAFVAEHGHHIDQKRISEKVAKSYTPGRFMGAMKANKDVNKTNMTEAAINMLVKINNSGLKSGRI